MKRYSKPEIKKTDPKKWYIAFNHVVPEKLLPLYTRRTHRFKIYNGINSVEGEEREQLAMELRDDLEYALKHELYNPFQDELEYLEGLENSEILIETKLAEIKLDEELKSTQTDEQIRKQVSIYKAFELFLESRKSRTKNMATVSTYRSTVKWLSCYFDDQQRLMSPLSEVTHIDISKALQKAKIDRGWKSNTSYNNEVVNAMTVFDWLVREEYLVRNPSKGRFEKLKEVKTVNEWYSREVAVKVKEALLKADCMPVYRACQFVYHICIRSKAELMKLKVSDIDRDLKRVRFSADLSKNSTECYRDYSDEFEQVLIDMELDKYPANFFVFGKGGIPGERKCHPDFLTTLFRPIRDELGLSDKYKIYSWKHTRTIHEMMKKTDPYQIQHLLRHNKLTTTMDYMRGFDISLAKVYKSEDLTF